MHEEGGQKVDDGQALEMFNKNREDCDAAYLRCVRERETQEGEARERESVAKEWKEHKSRGVKPFLVLPCLRFGPLSPDGAGTSGGQKKK
jgi:hypothetical protein